MQDYICSTTDFLVFTTTKTNLQEQIQLKTCQKKKNKVRCLSQLDWNGVRLDQFFSVVSEDLVKDRTKNDNYRSQSRSLQTTID